MDEFWRLVEQVTRQKPKLPQVEKRALTNCSASFLGIVFLLFRFLFGCFWVVVDGSAGFFVVEGSVAVGAT